LHLDEAVMTIFRKKCCVCENNSCHHVIQTKPFVWFHSFCFSSKRKCCGFTI